MKQRFKRSFTFISLPSISFAVLQINEGLLVPEKFDNCGESSEYLVRRVAN